jgi:hypothetical protein
LYARACARPKRPIFVAIWAASKKFGLRRGSVASDRRIGTQAEIDARLERKRSMPSQPRPAGIRSAPQQEYQRPKTAAEIVAEARRYRGFK